NVRRVVQMSPLLIHHHIIRVFDIVEIAECVFMMLELVSGGELFDYGASQCRSMILQKALFYLAPLTSSMVFLTVLFSQKSIVHRDLKLENILRDSEGHIKIIDFGIASVYSHDCLLELFSGTLSYWCPEIFANTPYVGPEAEVWSLGVLLYAMLFKAFPFENAKDDVPFDLIEKGDLTIPSDATPSEYLSTHMLAGGW
ncbi:kinase-like domain-containing protein, partial [Blyttiomyces helicus]